MVVVVVVVVVEVEVEVVVVVEIKSSSRSSRSIPNPLFKVILPRIAQELCHSALELVRWQRLACAASSRRLRPYIILHSGSWSLLGGLRRVLLENMCWTEVGFELKPFAGQSRQCTATGVVLP